MKYGSMYLLNNDKCFLQEKPLETSMYGDNNMYENVEKVLSLTTELLEKEKIIQMMKTSI